MTFTGNKMDVALFVTAILQRFGPDLQSITIMPAEKSGVYSATIVTDTLSVGTVEMVALSCSLKLLSI